MNKKNLYLLAILGILIIGIILGVKFLILRSINPTPLETRKVRIKNIRLEMVYIPVGEFRMGSNKGWNDEQPVHRVRITRGFWLGKTEVTQGLWKAVMNNNPSGFPKGDNYPVEQVSWKDCQRFISKLTELSGIPFRLPTEAEWEYACRAGTRVDYPKNLAEIAWYVRNSNESTNPVGLKQANAFGLHDMLGNIWEWCEDWYDEKYYQRSSLKDPHGPVIGNHRVDRGGGWAYNEDIVRPSRRDGSGTDYATNLIGFRLAASTLSSK